MSEGRPVALTLTIRNATKLDNGSPLALVLDRRSATIGRAASTDWPLPDPQLHLSSRHCDVLFRNGGYELVDNSTNGTFVNGETRRLTGPHRLADGDLIKLGHFELIVAMVPSLGTATPVAPRRVTASPRSAPAPRPAADPPAAARPSIPPPADDIWGRFAASNAVDWARGGFDDAAAPATPAAPSPAPPPPPPPPQLAPVAAPAATPASAPVEEAAPAAPPAETPPLAASPAEPAAAADGAALDAFLAGVGLPREAIRQDFVHALGQAGVLIRRLVAGMVVMMEARARAKSQMGAQSTGLEIAGNNPLKFARSPEQALQHVLNPPERGFMPAERAIEDAFRDLQAHQLATLKAMQGALRSTLDRFSPKSIRARAETKGLLEKIMPGARDAAMWKAYEREFSGVAFDSDEAFMDMFAKEFRRAYDEISREP